jgi:hypothetical protein
MDIGSIFLVLALLILVAMFVSRPLFEHSAVMVSDEEQEHSALLAERDRVVNALRELDFDHQMGKIPEDAYTIQRASLVQRGADLLRQLDEQDGGTRDEQDVNERLEAAISARRAETLQRGVPDSSAGQDDEIEALIAARRRARQEKTGGFCPQCGGPLQKSDRFCPKCGASL